MSALRICLEPGCPRVARREGRCPECYEAHARRSFERMDADRPSAAERGYDHRHREWRDAILARDPICRWPEGCPELSTVADHRVPISEGGSRFRMENGQGLCDYHHNVKRQQESTRAKRRTGGPSPARNRNRSRKNGTPPKSGEGV